MWCFNNEGKNVYFQKYVLGIQTPPTLPMVFGTIIHALYEKEDYDYKKAIIDAGFTSDYIRVADKINANLKRFDIREQKIYADCKDFCLFSLADGMNKDNTLMELKTSASPWSQQRVDETDQISHYLLAYSKFKKKNYNNACLVNANTKNGKIKIFKTHRTNQDLKNYYEKILQFKKDLQQLGFWDKKCKFADRISL
ncbi:hypothetical protein KAS79_04110 [Candidatus Parcubacteria bacterium]|nr:hypothetical protein [Candidatus Parcubacteria bacterium]